MTHSDIIKSMNEFMFRLAGCLKTWLSKKLPIITDNWWQELVLNNLSQQQRDIVLSNNVHDISGLDLASLLRVLDRNWFTITSKFFINNRERTNVKKMMEVRNTWAHITSNDITKDKVISDLETLVAVMYSFGGSPSDTRDIEKFILEIEETDTILDKPEPESHQSNNSHTEKASTIEIGSPVCLASDPSLIGAVIGIEGNRFKVIINGKIESFYEEQLRLFSAGETMEQVSLARVRTALTAYQINNPGAGNLYSLNSARIDFVPYQFRPALKLIKADSPKLLIADDVGLGKTIEAGLILKELEARSSLSSVLIICPRPLVAERKWELEMKRFDESFVQMDGKDLTEALSEMDRDQIWPDRYSKAIIPYSLFSEDLVMGSQSTSEKRKKGIGINDLDPLPHFDLVIVDEAHKIRNQNTWMYKGVELFCRNADAVLFLTATPLQNSTDDLYTLLNLLRPDIVINKDVFNTMSEPNQYINNLLRIVRNQEEGWQAAGLEEVSNILTTTWGRDVIQHNPFFAQIYDFLEKEEVSREERIEMLSKIESLHSFHTLINRTRRKDIEDFCVRRTQTVEVRFNSTQQNLYDAIIEFESTSLAMLHGSRSVRFMMCTLMRQVASCIYGLVPFIDDILNRRMDQIQEDGELYEFDYLLNSDDENLLFELIDEIRDLSGRLPEDDPKFDKLYEIVCQKQKEENNRVIVFSSFRHTLMYINEKLCKQGVRVGQIDGSVPDEDRFRLRQRFLMDRDEEEAIDVLLFSEVGCEGLDYQFCDTMINYDLPWNPMRIEQRIGRIDRRGQEADSVRIYNMITEGTIDATVYHRCLTKIGVFESSIGDCSEILGDISKQIMEIMFDPTLTKSERESKIEQLADNEVRKVQEIQKLEQDERSLYGFDLSNLIQTMDVQNAENMWISPQSIQEMVEMYLNDYLGEGEYIRGKTELKTMRLSAERRQKLLDGLSTVKLVNANDASRKWSAYLKSEKPTLQITFDGECAKDNRDAAFFTQMHPFVLQAASYESNELPCEVGLTISTDELPAGDYEFLIYVWKYLGLRPDIKLVAVSDNATVQKSILNYIQVCSEYRFDSEPHLAAWDDMDKIHYQQWQKAQESFVAEVQDECQYRLEQLSHSFNQRSQILNGFLENAADERIIRMRRSQLEKLQADFDTQKRKLDDIVKGVDIRMNLQVKGVLHVTK